MPILSISQEPSSGPTVSSVCINCLTEQKTPTSALQLGMEHTKGARLIALPPCACGAQEFLQQTFDVHPIEAQAGHRKAVNALAEHLKKLGNVHPKHVDAIKSEKTPAQVGALLGEVPDSSLPAKVLGKRKSQRLSQTLAVAAAAAQATVASITPPSDPDAPLAAVLKMFAQAQAGLKIVTGQTSPVAVPHASAAPTVILPLAPVPVIVAPAPAPLTPPTGNPTT